MSLQTPGSKETAPSNVKPVEVGSPADVKSLVDKVRAAQADALLFPEKSGRNDLGVDQMMRARAERGASDRLQVQPAPSEEVPPQVTPTPHWRTDTNLEPF